MSDNESYTSNNSSDNEKSDDELEISKKKPFTFVVSPNIDTYKENDDSDVESEEEESDEDEDEADEFIGGSKEDDEDADVIQKDDEDESIADESEDESEKEEDEENKQTKTKKVKKTSKPVKITKLQLDSDEEEDDEDDYDEKYLQKFDSEITKNYINDFHPECLHHNYEEISSMSQVVRDSNNIIIDPFHKTIPFLTKYEKAKILGQRAKQIESGTKPLINVPENVVDSYLIAELELKQKRIPFIIRRPIPGGACEYWNIKDLEFISY